MIDRDPDWSALHVNVPSRVSQAIQVCLRKDLKQRVRDISAVRLAMEGAFETTASEPSEPSVAPQPQVWQRPAPLVLAALALLIIGGLGVWAMMRPEPISAPDLVRFAIVPPDTTPLDFTGSGRDIAISPDGTGLVYRAVNVEIGSQLYLRRIDQLDDAPLRGGEQVSGPLIKPDAEWVGFVDTGTRRTLQKVSIFGGPPVPLTESPSPVLGASWGADDRIIFGTRDDGLFRVSGGGWGS